MQRWISLARAIDSVNDKAGKLFSFLLLPLVAIVTLEVICRYVFNAPTIWAWDVNQQILGALILIGGASALQGSMHVRVDILVAYLTPRGRAILDLCTSGLFFFAYSVLAWQSLLVAWQSVKIREHYSTIWAPPVYPLKVLIPVAVVLLLLQGLADFIRNVLVVMNRRAKGSE